MARKTKVKLSKEGPQIITGPRETGGVITGETTRSGRNIVRGGRGGGRSVVFEGSLEEFEARQKEQERLRQASERAKQEAEKAKAEQKKKLILRSAILGRRSQRAFQEKVQVARRAEENLRRNVIGPLSTKELRGKTTKREELQLAGAQFAQSLLSAGIALTEIPNLLKKVAKNPKSLKNIPSGAKKSAERFGQLARESPSRTIGAVGAEILTVKGIGKATSTVSKAGRKASTFGLQKATPGKTIRIPVGKGKKTINVQVSKGIPKESIGKQIKRAGRKSTVVTSSQADALVGLINRGRVVRKPLGVTKKGKNVESVLSKAGRKRLKAFDTGRINRKQIMLLDREIRKKGSKGILERSFFADPTGKIRPSRLGVRKEKPLKLLDYISEDITFKRKKPQVLLFQDQVVEKFPKSVKKVVDKLSKGQKITKAEQGKLLQFQSKKSGKFKALGFASRESELTLAPGELIKRVKKVRSISVNGRRVPIVKVEVYKPKSDTKRLLDKLKSGKINKKEVSRLDKRLKKETGINYNLKKNLSSRKGRSPRYVSPRRLSVNVVSSALSKFRGGSSPRGFSTTSSGKSITRGGSSTVRSGASSSRSPPRTPKSPPRVPPRPPRTPGKKPPVVVRGKKIKKKKSSSGRLIGYDVFGKSGKKFYKLNKIPLRKNDAKSRGAYAIDNTTSKTIRIVPRGKVSKLGTIKRKEKNYFNRNSRKLREYRKKMGKRVQLSNTYIERNKYGIDTRGEKKQLSLARLIKREKYRKR